MQRGQAVDYYKILGIDAYATQLEIKAAYRKAALKAHPDKNPSDQSAAEKFRAIREAYEILGDPQKRASYDEKHFSSAPVTTPTSPPPPPAALLQTDTSQPSMEAFLSNPAFYLNQLKPTPTYFTERKPQVLSLKDQIDIYRRKMQEKEQQIYNAGIFEKAAFKVKAKQNGDNAKKTLTGRILPSEEKVEIRDLFDAVIQETDNWVIDPAAFNYCMSLIALRHELNKHLFLKSIDEIFDILESVFGYFSNEKESSVLKILNNNKKFFTEEQLNTLCRKCVENAALFNSDKELHDFLIKNVKGMQTSAPGSNTYPAEKDNKQSQDEKQNLASLETTAQSYSPLFLPIGAKDQFMQILSDRKAPDRTEKMRALLNKHPQLLKTDIKSFSGDEAPALLIAIARQDIAMLKLFIELGADVNARLDTKKPVFFAWEDSKSILPGQTPLHFALELKRKMKDFTDNLDKQSSKDFLDKRKHFLAEPQAILEQSIMDIEAIIEILIRSRNINLEAGDGDKNTALHDACMNKDLKSIEVLVENGANINARNKYQRTPLTILDQIVGITAEHKQQVDYALKGGKISTPSKGCIIC